MGMEKNSEFKFEPLNDATVRRLVILAEETAARILPSLWQKLHSDLNHKKPLPEEVGELLGRRLRYEIFNFHVQIEIIKMNPSLHIKINPNLQKNDRNFLQNEELVMSPDTPLVRRVYSVFVRQLEAYRKKYKEDISRTILKAKEGNTKAICNLLKWDKSWVEFDFVHGEISRRGYRYSDKDEPFLMLVGDAISKKPVIRDYTYAKAAEKESGILSLIELYANRYALSSSNNKELKNLHNLLKEDGVLDSGTEEDGDPLANFKYFVLYLKRHNII